MSDAGKAKKAVVEQLVANMVDSGRDIGATGISAEEMVEVLRHPAAVDTIYDTMTLEASSPAPGDEAPDFCLRPLADHPHGDPIRLSDHRGDRPVALVFGSYT